MASEGTKGLVVVTGASAGIGAAIARKYSAEGHPLLLLARRVAPMEELGLPRCMCRSVDVSDLTTFSAAVEEAEKEYGPVSCLVNNAGIMLLGSVDDQDPAEWATSLSVNVVGVLNGIRVVLASMKERGDGMIQNVSSIAGFKIFGGHAVYCATKYGVHAITEAVRKENASTGIRVVVLSPGVVGTELLSHTTSDDIKSGYKDWVVSELKSKPVQPEDVAECSYFAYSMPKHVTLREMVIAPTHQVE